MSFLTVEKSFSLVLLEELFEICFFSEVLALDVLFF